MDEAPSNVNKLSRLAAKIALELKHARPDSDEGLLPINCLLAEVEELAAASGPGTTIRPSLAQARTWIDRSVERGTFNLLTLQRLHDWVGWLESALQSIAIGQQVPGFQSSELTEVCQADNASPRTQTFRPVFRNSSSNPPKSDEDRLVLIQFLKESNESLDAAQSCVNQLGTSAAPEAVEALFRCLHTFKGNAGCVGLDAVQQTAHHLESLLDLVRTGDIPVSAELVMMFRSGVQTLRRATNERVARIGAEQSVCAGPDMAKDGAGVAAVAPASAPALGNGDEVVVSAIELDRLSTLLDQSCSAAKLLRKMLRVRPNAPVRGQLQRLFTIQKGLRIWLTQARSASLLEVFRRTDRLARDIAARQNKEVEVVYPATTATIDSRLAKTLREVLMHLIRNAVDHGIEPGEVRLRAGKPRSGRIEMKFRREAGNLILNVEDDGAGLRLDAIQQKAIERGVLLPHKKLSATQIRDLIFASGFSTAERVSDISGRGVGLDAVRHAIKKAGGAIRVRSAPGRGCVFTFRLPLG